MAAGDTVYDSDMGTIKVYNGSSWNEMSSSTFTIDIDYLVVAGGGGSGVDTSAGLGYTGGSGAGGLLSSKDTQGRGVAAATTPSFTSGTQYLQLQLVQVVLQKVKEVVQLFTMLLH